MNGTLNKFENILDKVIKSQTMSDKPIGSFLSGGLDSSTIVFFASKVKPNLETFCITGPWGERKKCK